MLKIIKKFLWSIFGNDEEPVPPSWYLLDRPKWPYWFAHFVWLFVRNPLHNFTWHIIGFVGEKFDRFGDYPNDVFNPHGGWNQCIIIYKDKFYKFRSYCGKKFIKEFYLGWRERGDWGFKLKFNWRFWEWG